MEKQLKVMQGLECCKASTNLNPFQWCYKCPYNEVSVSVQECREVLFADALELLKEQEATIKAQQFVLNNACEKLKEQKIAMKPKNIDKVGGNCPVCGLRMARSHKYCYQCGQEMD